jgi:hypothetical protein
MVNAQWYDVGEVIGTIFAGVTALLVLVVRLEQWLERSETPDLAAADERERGKQDVSGPQVPAPHRRVGAGPSYRRPAASGWAAEVTEAEPDAAPIPNQLILMPHPMWYSAPEPARSDALAGKGSGRGHQSMQVEGHRRRIRSFLAQAHR